MARPFLVAQLSDPHIGADWAEGDPLAGFAAAIESVAGMPVQPDAVLVSGDLADHAADAEYEQVRELLGRLRAPSYVLAGNHDDRSTLRRHFDLPGDQAEAVQYAVDLGPLRLIALDTTRPGEEPGALDAERLEWLDGALSAAPAKPTLLAMHHPPILTGIPAADDAGLPVSDRQALRTVVERHPQVLRLVAGHVHRTISGELAGRSVLTIPSTYVQARLDFASDAAELSDEPAGFAVHALWQGELTSHIVNR
jgi:3',5'-cyclic-AMP phosphodiesterase